MAWQFVLADPATGASIGEILAAKTRTLTPQLNRMPTAAFTVRLDNKLAERMLTAEALVKVYQDKTLRFVGPIVSAEESAQGEGGTVKVTAAGPLWRLMKRLIGKDAIGYNKGTAGSPLDRGAIAQDILTTVNAEGDTGIRVGSITPSATGYVGPWRFKPAGEAIAEMSATLDGYDFEIAPVEPTADAGGLQIGTLNIAPLLGTLQEEAIFEYGTGRRNVAGYTRPVTLDGLMNLGWNLPDGFPDTSVSAPATQSDAASIAKWGRMEAVVPGDITVAAMRQKLVDEHIRIRKQPRQVITFEPARNAPLYGTDYDVGDIVPARARLGQSNRFDGLFRVYGVTISISEEGTVTEKLDLVPNT